MNDKQKGIIYIICAGFFFACMTFFVRLAGNLPTMQKAFFRNAVAVIIAVIMLARSEGGLKIKKKQLAGALYAKLLRNRRINLQFLCRGSLEHCGCKYFE